MMPSPRLGRAGSIYGLGAYPGLRDGAADQELLARNECLAAENRIMKAQLKGRQKLPDAEAGITPATASPA